jgi:V8-like Glu-specific endopeptidase
LSTDAGFSFGDVILPECSGHETTSGEFSMLTHNDLIRLKRIIGQHPAWRDRSSAQRRAFLRTAGLPPALVDNLLFDGTAADTEILVSDLVERRGRLVKYPAYTALGRLLDSLLKAADDGSLEIEGAWFLAQCVVRYRLIEDAAYLAELMQRFGVWSEQPDLGWKAQPYPSSWTWPSAENLEKIWSQRARFANSVTFFERGLAVARSTGRIETVPGDSGLGEPIGTGFLVGPNLLLTNYHVISPSDPLQDRQVRFGYRIDQAGRRQNGQTFTLKKILASSQPEELDFSLIQIEESPGDNPEIGFLRPHAKDVGKDTPVYVIQHPCGEPQKVVLQDNWCIGVSSDQRRVYYSSNTLGGSSGSPVCNEQWEVVALHHASRPTASEDKSFQGNEGILMKEIMPLIQQWLPTS